MTSPGTVYHEVVAAFPVILLLVFMVAGIYFMKELLLFTFTKVLLSIRSKTLISFLFCFISAFLSAFLDALTVTAVVISVAVGFYTVYKNVADQQTGAEDPDFEKFRAFLRNLLMHAAVGTALGGVCTTVGEPQNLLIASYTEWNFVEFFLRMAPGDHASTRRWF
jgi:NhaB family Na+:H+ antiporter